MARAGIYKAEVIRARNNLLAMGRRPSIDAIRIELGNTGSKGTIHRYLKEIEEEDGGLGGTQVALSEAIQDLAGRLAERLHEEAEQRISALTDKHQADLAELNRTIEALRAESAGFRVQVEGLTLNLAAERDAHAQSKESLQLSEVGRAQLEARIQGLEAQLAQEAVHRESLEEKHRHAREALEHFRVAAKEQREQEQRQFEQQLQFLQGELRAAKEVANTKQQELMRSHEESARLSSELAHARTELHRLDTELRPLRTAKEQHLVSEQKNQQLSEQLAHSEHEKTTLAKEKESLSGKLESVESATRQMEGELLAAKAVVASQAQLLDRLTSSPSSKRKGSKTSEGVSDKPEQA